MLQKCSILRVAEVFFYEPTKEHYLKEISKKALLAHTSTKNHLEELKKLSIIKETVEKKGKREFPIFKADFNNKEYKKYKTTSNLIKLKETKLIDFLQDKLMPKSIVLFGSYLKGEDIEDSDIDLFIECKEEKIDLSKFKKELKRNIQLHFNKSFKDFPNELKNNIANGLVLYGYLEVF
ncbi:MAG: nucleotidyltransferase domain-containing protein [Nanoarchaeota archaeon]|nr:nucleotidyltransferase domain-containing protein [Nanoarchaeota archaeon]MBU1632700.1 nucleotidyltransferase domain-containing protein [Nanoarchaeota archaeon]MBU1876276.1 nucleotidyltransferase domain-containing protein [Nanoarchaeota archaeon]